MNADDFVNVNPPKQGNFLHQLFSSVDGETSSTPSEAKPESEEPVEILAAPTPSNPSVPLAQPKPRTSHNPLDDVKIEKRGNIHLCIHLSQQWLKDLNPVLASFGREH